VLSAGSAAAAMVSASASSTSTVGSGKWSVIPTQSGSFPPPAGALTLTATSTTAQYFQVANTGTVSITALTYTVTVSSSQTSKYPYVTLTACSVAWSAGTCPGTKTVVATWSQQSPAPSGDVTSGTAVNSSAVPASNGSYLYLQAVPGNITTGATFVINTSVASGPTRQIRAATTTNA
jgi:hypothetical protein